MSVTITPPITGEHSYIETGMATPDPYTTANHEALEGNPNPCSYTIRAHRAINIPDGSKAAGWVQTLHCDRCGRQMPSPLIVAMSRVCGVIA